MEEKEFWRKPLLFGLGLLDFTKEKAEALVDDMVKRGEISSKETPEAVKQVLAKARETQQTLAAKVEELTAKAVSKMNYARAAELEALEARVAALEKEIAASRKP